MKNWWPNISFTLVVLFLLSCAQQVAPTGGPRDEDPPEILDVQPPQETLNYSGETIEITFAEFAKLNQLKKNLLISPPLKYDLQTKVRGKSLEIDIKDTLRENTTYVLNFGDAIVDITENNPISDFTYVFSTGPKIDTFSVSGRLVNSFDLKVQEDVLVMLYETTALDSLPFKEIPKYIDRTDDEGLFNITNVKEGTYSLFALKDGNNDYLFDNPDELIAYSDYSILVEGNVDSLKLYAFKEDRAEQFLENQKENGPQVILDFNIPVDSFFVKALDTILSEVLLFQEESYTKDSVIFWFKEIEDFELKLDIGDGSRFRDTIEVKIDSIKGKSPELKLEKGVPSVQNFFSSMNLKFKRPVKTTDTTLINLLNNDSTAKDFELVKDSSSLNRYILKVDWEEDSAYQIQMLPGAFTDIYEQTNDTISSKFSVNAATDFGNLTVTVNTTDTTAKIIQLTDAQGKFIKEQKLTDSTISFNNLKGGDYGLKLIFDENENGEWDTGNFAEGRQAERVWIYQDKITIRANWDQEIEWKLKL